ncbi:MAG: 30S ribosomal protein S2 [Candidatus Peregrinibacteria bacterium]|nr:30S ribosomal protein S2 [Candidatus Peregrinibacteria bacterium]
MSDISLKDMAASAVHFGHPTARWNPKMKPYIYGSRNGIHIFDLKITAKKLVEALEFMNRMAKDKKEILFVGTKQQCRKLLNEIKEETGMPIVTDKWIPGLLTNFKTIKERIDYFKQLKEDDAAGRLSKYTKKEQNKLRKKIQDLSVSLSGVENMRGRPDVVFVSDIVRDNIAVTEAKKLGIPVVGIVDTNADPDKVDYPIPGNDDAIKSLEYILGLAKEAVSIKK